MLVSRLQQRMWASEKNVFEDLVIVSFFDVKLVSYIYFYFSNLKLYAQSCYPVM